MPKTAPKVYISNEFDYKKTFAENMMTGILSNSKNDSHYLNILMIYII